MAKSEYYNRLKREENERKIIESDNAHKERLKKRGMVEYIIRYEFVFNGKPDDVREMWVDIMARDIMEAIESFNAKSWRILGSECELIKIIGVVEKDKR